ncbi:hypothetical protein C8R43DRAFT_1129223 [Mycena crocata]|nr:hypothetical protein C8R43DRAFT_1129223 [Mycena crocata]
MPHLRVLVILARGENDAAEFAQELEPPDERQVIVGLDILHSIDVAAASRWVDQFRTRADIFVSQKRAGEVEAACYYLSSKGGTVRKPPVLDPLVALPNLNLPSDALAGAG